MVKNSKKGRPHLRQKTPYNTTDMIQEVRDLNFDKEVQVKYEINQLKARKEEELQHIILRNRHLRRPDRDGEEKIIDEIEKSIIEKENELKNLSATDNDLIDSLLRLDEIIRVLVGHY